MTKKKPKEIDRRLVGFQVYGGGHSPVMVHGLWDITWSDGTRTIERGLTLHTLAGSEHLNGTKKQLKQTAAALRMDLAPHLRAIQALLEPVKVALRHLDDPKGKAK